jgi:hypothetical protein
MSASRPDRLQFSAVSLEGSLLPNWTPPQMAGFLFGLSESWRRMIIPPTSQIIFSARCREMTAFDLPDRRGLDEDRGSDAPGGAAQ